MDKSFKIKKEKKRKKQGKQLRKYKDQSLSTSIVNLKYILKSRLLSDKFYISKWILTYKMI